ncbi:TIGR03936 family radical SAM-associated protein [Tepidibacter hydrothermalis]|uniref:TIGR03936 family radical SAM-associated protein n=1 Tax=Tepidibacter hydrothermalis TaxID=3036126 RepID=A0ABY8EF20_9FIRM|nr:TIGR03936 family radical SAM-associated protein [Tepidibacter hydrothermalis]WFD11522.1 TIGR03936 family radical SAM-associated protein [Tepidibacter hydrothermalis]
MNVIRCKFTKEKDMIYISHLDLQRLLQRILRKAGIKVAYSQGFNPHPKISFGQALSLGVISYGEYIDVELEDIIEAEEFMTRVNNALPDGIKIQKAKFIDKTTTKSLSSSISHGSYLISMNINSDIEVEDIKTKVDEFMKLDEIINIKKNKKGKLKEVNIRPLIKTVKVVSLEENILTLNMLVSTGSSANLNPSVLLDKLNGFSDIGIDLENLKIIRNDLYIEENNKLLAPM